MSKYGELVNNPPLLKVKADAREVVFKIVSAMCDNTNHIRLRKDQRGDFKMNGMGYSLSNYQMKFPVYEIEWEADNGRWHKVISMINTGTSVVESLKCR